MPNVSILIQRDGEPPVLKSGVPDIHLPNESWTMVLLESGMASGAPSVAIVLPLPDGRTLLAENSLANLTMILAAARGAFPEAFVGGVFDPEISEALLAQSTRVVEALSVLDDGTKDAAWRVLNARQILLGDR